MLSIVLGTGDSLVIETDKVLHLWNWEAERWRGRELMRQRYDESHLREMTGTAFPFPKL